MGQVQKEAYRMQMQVIMQMILDGHGTCSRLWSIMQYDVCAEYRHAELQRGKYGYMPELAYCTIGGCLSESYCERVLSQANLVLTKGNTRLDVEKVRKLVVVRMNDKFLRWAKKIYSAQLSHVLNGPRHNMNARLSTSTSAESIRDEDIVSQHNASTSAPPVPAKNFEGVPRAADNSTAGVPFAPPSTIRGAQQ